MAVREGDDVDVLRLVAGLRHALDQMSVRHAALQRFIVLRQRAVAGVEQHDLLAGVDQHRHERMLELVGIDVVRLGQRLDFAGL